MLLHACTIFLSAFLLFQVQPVIARMILPWFGGSSAVWSTCMLFFQAALLGGYGYAHWLNEKLPPRRQAMVHSVLLAVSLVVLPIAADPSWRPRPGEDPSLRILGVLAATIGLPYFLLSSTSPLLQAWHARSFAGSVPYRLFALSNFASLLALLTYPFFVEPNLASRDQGRVWSVVYVLFAMLCARAAWRASRFQAVHEAVAKDAPAPPAWGLRTLWITLAGCASILFLAVTTALTQDVAPVPFLWIVPLSLYLMSFIICFDRPSWYDRRVFMPLLAIALPGLVWLSWKTRHPFLHLPLTIAIFSVSLFVCCMVCHGELARLKPHPRYLTLFYVMTSVGGAVGGMLVGLAAPNLFNSDYEFSIGLVLCAVLVVTVLVRQSRSLWVRIPLAAALLAFCAFAGYTQYTDSHGYLFLGRNFYGRLAVYDNGEIGEEEAARVLVHGGINHGQQMLFPKYRRQPVAYFCESSGIGRALRSRGDKPWRIGILGMGSGTLASYGRPGDEIRMYEINPLVPQLANSWFTYMKDSPAHVATQLGDGRLELERESSQQFDLLVMDAFSGDSVPVHLLTNEAFRTYFRHLRPGGMLAMNITNRYLDLRPVMARAAQQFGRTAWHYMVEEGADDGLCFSCDWVLILDPATAANPPALLRETAIPLEAAGRFRAWTDDFSNLLSIMK